MHKISEELMKIFSLLRVFIIVFIPFLFSNTVIAENLDFSDETVAKDIIEGEWICFFWDKYGEGNQPWKFTKVTGKKVVGESHFGYCPSKWATVKGKLKKNKMKIFVDRPAPCVDFSGVLIFKEDTDGDGLHSAEGTFTHKSEERAKGTLRCTKISKAN